MTRPRWLWVLVLVVLGLGCRTSTPTGTPPPSGGDPRGVQGAPAGSATTAGATAQPGAEGGGVAIGAPIVLENLTLFPIKAKSQVDLGPLTTLDAALRDGRAEVRELGGGAGALDGNDASDNPDDVAQPHLVQQQAAGSQPQPNEPHANRHVEQQAAGGGQAQVGTLVIENKGAVPIYVLAGTVVRGGKQDRQIGQDFVVEPRASVPIDAFCVEKGRWTEVRDGQATAGKFGSSGTLAVAKVRAAAQYEKDQSKVWKNVDEVNAQHGKQAQTSTLLATLDDAEVQRRVAALAAQARGALERDGSGEVVGFAYAVDGKVRAIRWFAHEKVFALFRASLLEAAALDALTAQAGAPAKTPPALAPDDVTAFMRQVDEAPAEETATPAANVNEYRKSEGGYGSTVKLKPKAGAPPAATAISHDYYKH